MKIAFVGSATRLDLVRKVVDNFFTNISPVYLADENSCYSRDVENMLIDLKPNLDACIFTGELHHAFYNRVFFPDMPCDYIRKDWASLQNALLSISAKGIEFKKTSIDSYTKSTVHILFEDLSPKDFKSVHVIQRSSFDHNYMEQVYMEHKEHFESGKVDGCITALSPVFKRLCDDKIPCVYARPTSETITNTVNNMIDAYEQKRRSAPHLAMMHVHILPRKEFSYIRKDEYLYMHERLKVADEVYYFAKNTNAAVVSESVEQFLILMNKKDLLDYTNGLQRFYFLNAVKANSNCDVNIGIGYGYNPSEAKYNASIAMEKFEKTDRNLTFIVPGENSIIGPIDFLIGEIPRDDRIEEAYIEKLTKSYGISPTLLYKLYALFEHEKRNTFTLNELSEKLDISQRNSSRLMQKLEQKNLANVVGKKITGNSGRPSTIYEINIFK